MPRRSPMNDNPQQREQSEEADLRSRRYAWKMMREEAIFRIRISEFVLRI
jgi:hypothetical protein